MDAAKPRSAHYFDRFVLDVARGVLLTTDGRQVPLRPKSFAMLKLFVENTGLLLDHDCIMQAVWPGLIIANEGIVQCVRDIRRALGDDSQRILKTVPRRGYVFVVEAAAHVRTGGDGSQSAPGEFDTMSDRPSVAVLPLNAATPDEAYVAAGLAEDLITALARLRSLTVIPGAFGFPGQVTQDPRHAGRVGRALSADYVLEGGVRQAGTHLRVTTRLVSSATEAVVWADRLEGEASELFALQDLITRVVTVAVETHVLGMEIERVMRKGSSGLGARDLYVRALPGYRAQTAESMAGSIALLRRAVALDPGCARALATLAHCLQQQITQGWRAHHADAATEALALARQALVADRSDPVVLAVAGFHLCDGVLGRGPVASKGQRHDEV